MPSAHIITNPAGSWSIVGRVPAHPRTVRFLRPSDPRFRAAVMGRRVVERHGKTYGWCGRAFPSRAAADRALRLASN